MFLALNMGTLKALIFHNPPTTCHVPSFTCHSLGFSRSSRLKAHSVKELTGVCEVAAELGFACKLGHPQNRDPYIIHLNIAWQMVVYLHFGGKSNMFQMVAKWRSFKEPCKTEVLLGPGKGSKAVRTKTDSPSQKVGCHLPAVTGLPRRMSHMLISMVLGAKLKCFSQGQGPFFRAPQVSLPAKHSAWKSLVFSGGSS